ALQLHRPHTASLHRFVKRNHHLRVQRRLSRPIRRTHSHYLRHRRVRRETRRKRELRDSRRVPRLVRQPPELREEHRLSRPRRQRPRRYKVHQRPIRTDRVTLSSDKHSRHVVPYRKTAPVHRSKIHRLVQLPADRGIGPHIGKSIRRRQRNRHRHCHIRPHRSGKVRLF